jgi:uncharacterized protein YndB with AHSA1/START domain
MLKKTALAFVVLIVLFLGYVSTRESSFRYERSGVINAPADKIFPYISQFRLGEKWSPYEKVDPNLKKTFKGTDGQVGSIMEFDGNMEAGSGQLELLNLVPNESVDIKLTMTKPMFAENLIQYRLTPEAGGTRFTWTMSGDGGFMTKLMTVFIDCEKMIGGQFTQGIENLKTVVESQK